MAFTKDKFTLFFSMPPDDVDWANLRASRARRVMLPLWLATPELVERLRQAGVGHVTVRLEESDYYTPAARSRAIGKCGRLRGTIVATCILGVEPENGIDLSYGSPDWGHARAREHADAVQQMAAMLAGFGWKLVSPGWTARVKSETEIAPGEHAWRELCAPAYQALHGCGVHIYTYQVEGIVDELRLMWLVSKWAGWWHKPIYIDEIGVDKGTQVERMRVYLWVASYLLNPRLPANGRVEMLCPFVSNGDPGDPNSPKWPPGLLLRDPECYRLLGAWMSA